MKSPILIVVSYSLLDVLVLKMNRISHVGRPSLVKYAHSYCFALLLLIPDPRTWLDWKSMVLIFSVHVPLFYFLVSLFNRNSFVFPLSLTNLSSCVLSMIFSQAPGATWVDQILVLCWCHHYSTLCLRYCLGSTKICHTNEENDDINDL